MLTQKRLKEILEYNQDTGVFNWKEIKQGRSYKRLEKLNKRKKNLDLIKITIDRIGYKPSKLAWLYVYGYLPEGHVICVNGKKNDYRIANLKEISNHCLIMKSVFKRKIKRKTGKITGVYYYKKSKKWRALLSKDKKVYNMGVHNDLTEAVAHRLAAEQCFNLPGCHSTSPAYIYMQEYLKSTIKQ